MGKITELQKKKKNIRNNNQQQPREQRNSEDRQGHQTMRRMIELWWDLTLIWTFTTDVDDIYVACYFRLLTLSRL